jgi:serine/threonine protein kinase
MHRPHFFNGGGMTMADLTGKTLGKYQMTELLGRGGMAEVYKAHHQKLDRIVTIKVLHSHLAEGRDFLERFTREAKAAAGLRHPNIVQVHDFDVEDDRYYMVMDYIDGGSLQERLEALADSGAHLPFLQVVDILRQVAGALDFAHQQGIIHRDVKPSNILLDRSGNAYLTDFGIARIFGGMRVTASGALIGTPAYMSPEQGRGDVLTPASDIYSLGVILYEMVTGKVPFDADTPVALILKHMQQPLPPASSLRPGLPAELEAVIGNVLSKAPEDRYVTATEMVNALQAALPGETMAALDAAPPAPPKKHSPIADLPTMKMEEEEAPALVNPTDVPVVEKKVEPPTPKPAAPPPQKGTLPAAVEPLPEKEAAPVSEVLPAPRKVPSDATGLKKLWQERKALVLAIGAALVMLVIILLVVLLSPHGGSECTSIPDCASAARELSSGGEKQAALQAFDRAIGMVPAQDHIPNAVLWCDRAGVAEEMHNRDEAIRNYEMCIEWTQGDPAQEGLRLAAMENINRLRGP